MDGGMDGWRGSEGERSDGWMEGGMQEWLAGWRK